MWQSFLLLYSHRFRIISATAEYIFELSIDNHMWVVASDGAEIEPIEVNSVIIDTGETIDIEVNVDQVVGQYWMRARLLNAGTDDINFGERPFPKGGDIKEVKAIFK